MLHFGDVTDIHSPLERLHIYWRVNRIVLCIYTCSFCGSTSMTCGYNRYHMHYAMQGVAINHCTYVLSVLAVLMYWLFLCSAG